MTKFFTYTLFTSCCLYLNLAIAQTQIQIINADEISFNKKINEDRQLLIGNVKTKHENRFMSCDSAYYYGNENKIEAFSNIHVWQGDTLSLKGDYLLYHGNNQLAEIHHNVLFNHNEMNLTTAQLNYNFQTEKGDFNTRGIITNKNKSLISNKGVYYSTLEKFDFFGEVLVEDENEKLRADTLYYWLNTEIASFKSNGVIENEDIRALAQQGWVNQLEGNAFLSNEVIITQLQDSYTLYSDTCIITQEKEETISYGNTLLELPFNDDTLYLTTDTLFNYKKEHLIKAYFDVNFNTNTITGHCDSLSFDTQLELIYLNQTPVLWLEEFQLTADTIQLLLDESNLERAYLNKDAFIHSNLDSTTYNQISGIDMQAHFEKNELRTINVYGNGESIYYIQEDETNEIIGLNKIICSNMDITIKERSLKNIKFLQKPDATLYPIDEIMDESRFLEHFKTFKEEAIKAKIKTKIKVHKAFK